ncbi:MAG: exo-beta-N-acetylmuramidase NamZ domain-containing protein [Bacteroidota bacterium]
MVKPIIFIRALSFTACLLVVMGCVAQQKGRVGTVGTGASQISSIISAVGDKRVGMFVNQTAMVGNTHVVDTLLSRGVRVVKIYSPEHGFRGDADAGEDVGNGTDPRSGVPIVSLYGPNKKPKPEQLADVDVVLFDMQDIGVRFFTYISSLHYMIEACAEQGKPLIILDRPNPNGGYVDGPMMETAHKSFVGMHPIPVVHGMTIGEYARMVNGERWLSGGLQCDLKVIPVTGWKHGDPWHVAVKPSPNLPNDHAIRIYPSTCFFEGTVLSIGRGTMNPFEQTGHPDLKNYKHTFTPVSIPGMSKTPPLMNQLCHGLDFRTMEVNDRLNLAPLIELYNAFPDKDKFFISYFEKLAGTATLREQIRQGVSEEKIRESWQPGLKAFREMRKKYLLYP